MGLISYLFFAELSGASVNRATHAIEQATKLIDRSEQSNEAANS